MRKRLGCGTILPFPSSLSVMKITVAMGTVRSEGSPAGRPFSLTLNLPISCGKKLTAIDEGPGQVDQVLAGDG